MSNVAKKMMGVDRLQKVLMFALGTMEGLIQKGLMARDPGSSALTPSGMEVFRQLEAEGFEMTADEVTMAVTIYRRWNNEEETSP